MATIVCFVAAQRYAQHASRRIDHNAVSIATNSAPSVVELTAARGALFALQHAATNALDRADAGEPLDRTPLLAARSQIEAHLKTYLALPFYPHERSLYAGVDRSLTTLDAAVDKLFAALAAGDARRATRAVRDDLEDASERLDAGLQRLVTFNADEQTHLAGDIPPLRMRSDHLVNVLDAVSAVLALLLLVLVLRAAHVYSRAIEARRDAAEARANDLDAFNRKLEAIAGGSVEISGSVSGGELEPVFETIVNRARAVTAADYAGLRCGDDDGSDTWIFAGLSDGEEARIGGPLSRSPIRHQGRTVGELYLARAPGRPGFDMQDEHATELLAAFAGVAIDNARLYREAQVAVQARQDLLATVTHDLRNPIGAIRLAAGLLRRPGPRDVETIAGRIERQADRTLTLINDLLDVSETEAGTRSPRSAAEEAASLVEEAMEMFRLQAAEKSVTLTARVMPSLPPVLCERRRVLRVFANLVGNAIKFCPDHGAIVLAATRDGGHIRFDVIDTGPGIPPEALPHVFERYWHQQGGRSGSGLGLYIAKQIVEAHGGRISADSKPGAGATLTFTLPVATLPSPALERVPSSGASSPQQ